MTIRSISLADLDLICRHRREMFKDAGQSEEVLTALAEPFRQWAAPRLADGRYFGFIAEESGEAVGGIGLMELDWPPHPAHPLASRRGYALNLFVDPAFRRRGIAQALLDASETEFRKRGLTYEVLHATAAGRPLYERNGWGATSEMGKSLTGPT
jgi:GNAT superfamily N-acetyltransferase